MQMKDRPIHSLVRGTRPDSRDGTEVACFEGHVVAWQNAFQQSIILSSSFDSARHAFGRADHGAHGGSEGNIVGIERMYYDMVRRRAFIDRFWHGPLLIELKWESMRRRLPTWTRLAGADHPAPCNRG